VEINEHQYLRLADCWPRQRGNVSLSNLQVLNAILYVAEHGCKWRGLPKDLGNWHTIYTRMNRWSKAGVLDRVFARLQQEQIIAIKFEAVSLDRTTVKVPPDGTGALKKLGRKPLAVRAGGCTTKIHLVAAHARCALNFSLSPGRAGDAPQGRALLRAGGPASVGCHLIMDRAYEGDETRDLTVKPGYIPVVPPKTNRLHPWKYDRCDVSPTQRNRTALPPAQRLPPRLFTLRQAQCDVCRLCPLCANRRRFAL